MSLQRADLMLVERGYFESRAKAQEAIAAGLVRIDGKPLRKPAELIGAEAHIEASAPYPWDSRGGVKLAGGLEAFGFHPKEAICLDVGASTGRFTDVQLARGAAKIYAVDVGHKQLHARFAANPRVVLLEGNDARRLTGADFAEAPAQVVKGVVKDTAAQKEACAQIEALLRDAGWQTAGLTLSPILGADGNREFLIGAVR